MLLTPPPLNMCAHRQRQRHASELHGYTVISLMRFWDIFRTDLSSPPGRVGVGCLSLKEKVSWDTVWKVTLSSPVTRGEILIKVFHAAINSCWPWPLCGSVDVCVFIVAMSSKLVHREMSVTCLSLSCKNAAVQDMTATALEGPLWGCRTFPGKWLEK